MRRDQVEGLLIQGSADSGGAPDFDIIVPEAEISSVLSTLKHLQKSGQMTSFSRRDAQSASGRNDCIRIYGYTG